jgi:hypothetical protein
MGGGVSALGAVARGCIGEVGAGVSPHRKKRFLGLVPCLALLIVTACLV